MDSYFSPTNKVRRWAGGVGNWATGFAQSAKNFFPNLFNQAQQGWNQSYDPETGVRYRVAGEQYPLYAPPVIPSSYQVKEGDTFASIGAQYGLNEKDLQDRNKMLVPPPKGSFITINPSTGANSFYSGNQVNTGSMGARKTVQQLINQGVPPAVAAQMAGQQPGVTSPAPFTGPGANSFTSGPNVNLTELRAQLQSQIANNIAPQNVPGQLLNALGATPQTMAANGYVLNPANNTWVLGGTGANNNNDKPDPYSEVKSVYYSRSRGYVTPEVAALLNKKKRRRADRPKDPTTFATNAGGTPVNTLDVRVGSG